MARADSFLRAREVLFRHREDYAAAYREFRWPDQADFNWARDWFDVYAKNNDRAALRIVAAEDVTNESITLSFAEMSERSTRVARWLLDRGIGKGDVMIVMLPNVVPLWELVLAAIKIGAVIVPATTQLTADDLADRLARSGAMLLVTDANGFARTASTDLSKTAVATKILVGGTGDADAKAGWIDYERLYASPASIPDIVTTGSDPFLLYFTSGTTAKPKLVQHTQHSYPIGHLSTMYWIGLREGDVHLNISSPGWAKHAWSSIFAPWNAGATVLVHDYARFSAPRTIQCLNDEKVATLCAPPTVWRMMLQTDLGTKPDSLREMVSAGEPLNPEVIDHVRRSWGLTLRDGFGQTETTCQVGNSPGQPVKLGSMGRPLPGYDVVLLDSEGNDANEGELALKTTPRPLGLMVGYSDDPERTGAAMANDRYRTGDEATRDDEGYLHYVGRGDDVFKSSDYRISPFELESVLLEHPAVAEAAIVPSPDALRLSVPKAFVVLAAGALADAQTAKEILRFCKDKLAPYKRIRRLEFAELPKTISGKIRRVELRKKEEALRATDARAPNEHWLDD